MSKARARTSSRAISWPAASEVTDNAWESWQSVDGCAAHWLDGWSKSPRANPVGVNFPELGGASERRLVIELPASLPRTRPPAGPRSARGGQPVGAAVAAQVLEVAELAEGLEHLLGDGLGL